MKGITLAATFLVACVLHPEEDESCAITVVELMDSFDKLECETRHNEACGQVIRYITVLEDGEYLESINQAFPEPMEFLM